MSGAVCGLVLGSVPAQSNEIGYDGCTPGYWKDQTDNWQEAALGDLLSSHCAVTSNLSGIALEQAFALSGGPGAAGAERILVRAAAAASCLNAAHEGLGFRWRRMAAGLDGRPKLVPTVNAAIASDDRGDMLDLAERLDDDNDLGCPLN
ncbi:MAG: hypothetical protein ACRDO2_14275 [Nocardioidaceae bacterium]